MACNSQFSNGFKREEEAVVNTPIVTIILPVYNGERYLCETLDSIAAQTFSAYEIIVIDDGSTDNSIERIEEWQKCHHDIPLNVIRQENAGVAAARNAGVNASKGTYIAFIDQDDLWDAQKLEIQVTALKESESVWHYASFVRFYNDGREKLKDQGSAVPRETWYRLMRGDLFIPPSVAMVKKDVCAHLAFIPELTPSDDWDYFLKLSKDYPCSYSKRPLLRFRSHPGSTGKVQRRKLFLAQLECLKRHAADASTTKEMSAVRRRHARILWHLGNICNSEGNKKEARVNYLQAIKRDPGRVKSWQSYLRTFLAF